MIYLILLAAFLLRLIHLSQSLWLDEAITVVAAAKTLPQIYYHLQLDFHPPLYYYILHFWIILFGQAEWVVRLPSVIFGVGTIYFVYKITLTLFSKKTALLAALLLTLSQFHIYYSQEARMYSLVTLASTASIYFLAEFSKERKKKSLIFYFLSTLVAIYSDYFAFFVVFAQILWVFAKKVPKTVLGKLIFVWAALALGYIFWIPRFIDQIRAGISATASGSGWVESIGGVSPKSIPLTLSKFAVGNFSFDDKLKYLAFVIIPTAVCALLITKFLLVKRSSLVYFWLVIPTVAAFLISLKLPIYAPFRLLLVLPAFWVAISAGSSLFHKKLAAALVAIVIFWQVVAIFGYSLDSRWQREDWRSLARYIEENSNGEKAITIFENKAQYSPYLYYAQASQVSVGGRDSWRTGSYDTIWLMRYLQPLFDPTDSLRLAIEKSNYQLLEKKHFRGVEVWRYQK